MTDWCILKTAPKTTLQLARSLADAGFACWTPAITETIRVGPKRTRKDVVKPVLPEWVFAEADRTLELLALSHSSLPYRVWDKALRRMVDKGHPKFEIFGNGSRRPIPDSQLRHLRLIERKGAPKEVQRTYAKGDLVKLTEAGFEGLMGTVDAVRGKHTWVIFPSFPSALKVPTWVLLSAEPMALEKAA